MWINISSGFYHNRQKIIFGEFFFCILQLCTRLLTSYDSDLGPFCSRLQLCTRFPSSYDSDLGPFCSRQLRGLPCSDGYFFIRPFEKRTYYAVRAGQDQGGPRWDTLTKKSKSTKLLHIVLCYTQDVVAYDPVLFGGCIPPPLTPLQVKPEALILISIGGRTLQCVVMYIFYVLVLPKLTFITYCGIGKSKDL